jgi:thioredoxin 1
LIKRLAVVAAALLVFAATFILKESQKQPPDAVTDPASAQVTEKALPRLVDLGSDKCIPCKKMAPILESLSREYQGSLVVEVLDVRKDPQLGSKWGIRVIPTQVFIDASGEERFRHEGFMAKQAILAKWKELGVELSPGSSDVGS